MPEISGAEAAQLSGRFRTIASYIGAQRARDFSVLGTLPLAFICPQHSRQKNVESLKPMNLVSLRQAIRGI
jgi:hypothetical protein